MRIASIMTRLTSLGATAALVATGLVVTTLVAPAAAADVSPVLDRTPTTVTADALPTTQIDGVAWSQTIVGNNVYVGGQFTSARPAGAAAGTNLTTRNNLLAYDVRTGALVTGFTPSLNAQAKIVTASPDGTRIYVGGTFTQANGATRYRIAAYSTATGQLVTNFAPAFDASVNTIVATNTTVYVGGIFSKVGSQSRNRLAAVSASNGALLGWAPTADSNINAMVISPDGAVIIGGAFQNVNGSPAYGLAKLDPGNGALLPWNATNLIRNAGSAAAILSLSTDGTAIYGTGYTFGGGGNLEGTFSADPATGNINWVEDCHGDTYDHYVSRGVVYTVSHAHYCGNIGGFDQSNPWAVNMRHAMAYTNYATGTAGHDPYGYYDYYGTPSPSLINWFPDLAVGTYTGKSQAAWSVTGNGTYVVLGGEFPSVNGIAQQGLVRFAVAGTAPSKVGPTYSGVNSMPSVIGLPTGAARVAWQANTDRDDLTLTYKVTRNGQLVYQTTDSSPFWKRPTLGFIDSTVVAGTTYSYRLSATDGSGNVSLSNPVSFTAPAAGSANAYSQRVVADGASPYWPMNEASGTTLFDNSGFNDADTGAGVARGVLPGAVASDASTLFDGATSASTRTAVQGPDTYTIQAWINTTTTSGGKILGFGGSSSGLSGSYDRQLYMDDAGHIWYGVYPNAIATLNSTATYNDGQWHQITATLGPDGMKLFIDAKLVGQRGDVTWGQNYTGYWRVGGDNLGAWPNQPSSSYFAGAIDEVAIYPTVLTRQAINAQWVTTGRASTIPTAPADAYGAAVFNDNPLLFWRLGEATGTTAADSSQNGDQTGIYQGGVTLGAAGGIKGTTNTAASFDGNDDFVASSNSYSNPMNYSLEAWFKTTTTNGGKIIGFGCSQTGTSGCYDRHIYMSNDGTVTFGVWTGFTNTITSANALNDGQWHHVVASQSSTDGMKMYVDGALVGTNGQTSAQDYSGFWRVGGDNHWGCCSPFLNATIDDAAVYNTVLSPSQVANHFNLGNTVVAANQVPAAAFTSSAVYLDASFDGSTSVDPDGSIAGYSWNFGDAGTSTLASPAHSYTAAGVYTVTLTVTDNRGDTNVITHPITVTAPPANVSPNATFSVNTSVLTASVDATGSNDPDGSIAGYAWTFGDGSTATGATASHTYVAAGSYTVTLVVTDNKGATSTTTQTAIANAPVNQAPTAGFTVATDQLTATFNGAGSSDADGSVAGYSWNFGDTQSGTGVNPSHVYATAGRYTVTLTVTDNQGATNSSAQPVDVSAPPANVPPVAEFTSATDGLTANVESTSTDPDGGTIVGYNWSFGDGGSDNTSAAVHHYTAAGTYTVTLTVTDNNGGSTSVNHIVTVTAPQAANVPPTAAFTFTTANLQASVDGSGSADSDGTVNAYSWDFGDGSTDLVTTPTAAHTYAAGGTYQVSLTVTDNSGAITTLIKAVTVTAPAPTPMATDAFGGRTQASGWGSADTGGAWTLSGGASNFSVSGGTGKVRLTAPGVGPSATLGAPASANVSLAMDVSLDKPATGGGVYISLAARKVGNSEYRTTLKLLATGVVQLQLVKVVNGVSTTLRTVTVAGLTYTPGDSLTVRLDVTGSSAVLLNAKVWKTGTTEPAAWQVTATDSVNPLSTTGGIALYPYMSGTSTNAPLVASFDNLKVFATQP